MSYARIEHAGGAIVTTLATGITSGDTSLTLAASTNWPSGSTGPFYLVIDPGLAGEEKILATARSSVTLSGLTRGVDGTSAAAHATGAVIQHVFSSSEADEANALVKATLGTIAAKGDTLTGSAASTLSKTAVGANDTVYVADSAQTGGVKWSTLGAASIASDAITTAKIIDSAVTSAKIADGTIVTADLADSSVTSAKIVDATIATGDLANLAVTAAKIASGTITTLQIANGTVLPVDLDVLCKTYNTFSVTTNSTGVASFPHGFGVGTPSACFIQPISPSSGSGGAQIFSQCLVTAIDGTDVTIRALSHDGTAMNTVAITGYFWVVT